MKIRSYMLAGLVVALATASSGAFGQEITVAVNGSKIFFQNQPPTMIGDRVFVPLRGVFENLGARVEWDPQSQTVTAYHRDTTIRLTIGQNTASVNGDPVQLDVPAQIIDGSTMVPLRFIGEALGDTVHWNGQTYTVDINEGGDYDIRRPHRDRPPVDSPPTIVVPPPDNYPPDNGDYPPPPPEVTFHPDTIIPIIFAIGFSIDECHRGQHVECPVPHYPGLPPGCRAEGNVENVTIINNVRNVTINYTTIVMPSGERVPIQGHAVATSPRDLDRGQNGVITLRNPQNVRSVVNAQTNSFAIKLEKPVHIVNRPAGPGPRGSNPPRPINVRQTDPSRPIDNRTNTDPRRQVNPQNNPDLRRPRNPQNNTDPRRPGNSQPMRPTNPQGSPDHRRDPSTNTGNPRPGQDLSRPFDFHSTIDPKRPNNPQTKPKVDSHGKPDPKLVKKQVKPKDHPKPKADDKDKDPNPRPDDHHGQG